jgi:hypothetical protein
LEADVIRLWLHFEHFGWVDGPIARLRTKGNVIQLQTLTRGAAANYWTPTRQYGKNDYLTAFAGFLHTNTHMTKDKLTALVGNEDLPEVLDLIARAVEGEAPVLDALQDVMGRGG